MEVERSEEEEGGQDVGASGDPGDTLRVDRVDGKQRSPGSSPGILSLEEPPAEDPDKEYAQNVEPQVRQVEAGGPQSGNRSVQGLAEGDQRAVVAVVGFLESMGEEVTYEVLGDRLPVGVPLVEQYQVLVIPDKAIVQGVGVDESCDECQGQCGPEPLS
jgi:hypothetical protein